MIAIDKNKVEPGVILSIFGTAHRYKVTSVRDGKIHGVAIKQNGDSHKNGLVHRLDLVKNIVIE